MEKYLSWLSKITPGNFSHAFRNRFLRGPITTAEGVADFVQTRAAYVAQTSLFGYLKERMGISYPRYFHDDVFVESIRIAQVQVYHACAADLAIFSSAVVAQQGGLAGPEAARLAMESFSYALKNSGREANEDDLAPAVEAFEARAKRTSWPNAAVADHAFTESPPRLVEAAPVIDIYKEADSEIVMNSIRFRWRDVREQFRKRVNAAAISSEIQTGAVSNEAENGI